MATAIATTRVVKIDWTRAARIRMTAKIDMPEYGLVAGQVFYLVRSSANDDTYYILTWSYERKTWDCPCKHSTERPNARPCRHRRIASDDCKARRDARLAAAARKETSNVLRRQEGLVQAPNGNWLTPEQLANVPGAPRATYEAARASRKVTDIEKRLTAAGLMRR